MLNQRFTKEELVEFAELTYENTPHRDFVGQTEYKWYKNDLSKAKTFEECVDALINFACDLHDSQEEYERISLFGGEDISIENIDDIVDSNIDTVLDVLKEINIGASYKDVQKAAYFKLLKQGYRLESTELFIKEYEDAQKMIKILDENSDEWLRYNRHVQELNIPKQLTELDNRIKKLNTSAFRFLLTRQIEKLRQKEKELYDLLDKASEERPWRGYSYPEFYLMDNVSQENLDNLMSKKRSFVAENGQEYKYYISILRVGGD